MALAFALLLLAAPPDSGAIGQARATVRIVEAVRVDLAKPDRAPPQADIVVRHRIRGEYFRAEAPGAYRLIEFQ